VRTWLHHLLRALLLLALTWPIAVPTTAAADALQVQFSTRVGAGERPRLVLVASEAVGPVQVTLTDEAGHTVNTRVPRLAAGAKHEVLLGGEPGRHRYQGQLTVQGAAPRPLTFETVVAPRLEVSIDRARVDLANHRLEARLSRPADKVEISVVGLGPGDEVNAEQSLAGQPAGATLVVRLPEVKGSEIARIDLRFFDVDGFYTSVALHPWKLFIPHEEVSFATDSATIAPAERPKLEASLNLITDAFSRHQSAGPVKLYIAGHTDTVGTPEHNLRLSRARAAAIASWFTKRGLRLPILCEGFGELAPAVVTPDQTDEPRNRRVDYILAVEDPVLGGQHRPVWRAAP
jgi:outer membrane protein OmpA-like peptidoglycan-associated protein